MDLLERVRSLDLVLPGEVPGTSGITLPFYVLAKKIYGSPAALRETAQQLIQYRPAQATFIVGTGHGGIPLATAISLQTDLPLSLLRSELKGHGVPRWFDGYEPQPGDNGWAVDDVLTTGKSLRYIHERVTERGATIAGNSVIVKRREVEFAVHYLFTEAQLL
jgi:orotate phosphoribosyltransferase